jgi:DNA repair protein SbcC/Rad50
VAGRPPRRPPGPRRALQKGHKYAPAAGQARPLERVIIDEGFGSLDRDGLRAAADELNRLRQHLRRVVLVSHQEDFADRFPVVIKLTAGATGTTADAVRR